MKWWLIFLMLVPQVSWSDAINVTLSDRVIQGQGFPAIHLEIVQPILGFRLVLSRDGGKSQEWKGGGKPGVTRSIDLAHPPGTARWEGELTANLPQGKTASMPLQFETAVLPPLTLTVDNVDVVARKVTFHLNQPIAKAHLKVQLDNGKMLFDDELAFNAESAGTKVEAPWPEPQEGRVLRVDLRAFSTLGVYDGVELTPWRVDIPHDEVNFASGKWDIAATELPKLEASFALIRDAIERYGSLAPIKLYLAGHTDTVGTIESNRALSLQRARSIGSWFRSRGIRVPIFYEGFGEQALLIATGDEKDEVRNRRAEYVVAIDDPATKNVPFTPRWQRL